mgnify:CR=1 FL=1
MKIRIGMRNGIKFIEDCEGKQLKYRASRKLTGTTGENDDGVFTDESETFRYGYQERHFDFSKLDLFERGKERKNLLERIKMVQDWIAGIDYEAEFEI